MSFILNQFALAFFNLVNSRVDAYRILKHKGIAHGINFVSYALFTALVVWVADYNWPNAILFCLSAFFNRNVVFDAALNKRRGLSIFYQSTANPPKAWWDKVEKKIFKGWDGQDIFFLYVIMWGITTIIKILWLW